MVRLHTLRVEYTSLEGYGTTELKVRAPTGHQIPTIENLGGTRDAFEAIDLTDNAITLLGNFPRSLRLQTLLLARNRVNCIHSSLAKSLPNLRCLVLTGNPLEELADLDPLHACSRLEFVSLLECPVSAREVLEPD